MTKFLFASLLVLCTGCTDIVVSEDPPEPEVRIKVNHFGDGVSQDTIVFLGRVFDEGPADTLHYSLEVTSEGAILLARHGFFAENQFQATLAYNPDANLTFTCIAWIVTDTSSAIFSTR